MTTERISELRALCAEYEKKKASCEAAGLKDKAADIAADGVGRRALEALPELLDYVQKIETAKVQFLQTVIDQNRRYQERYSVVQQMIDHYKNMNNASFLSIGGIECCGRLYHD